MLAAFLADVVGHPEEPDAARREQDVLEDLVEVGDDLRRRRPLVEAGVRTVLDQAVLAERARGHAVGRRRLVEPDERVGVEPVPAGPVAPVDQQHVDVRVLGDQRVDERHPRRTAPTTK